jgi:hypothetical protein
MIMKKLFSLIAMIALVMSVSVNAATSSVVFGASGSTDLVDGLVDSNTTINSVTMANASGSAITVSIYNAPVASDEAADLSYVIPSFTAWTRYSTNIVESYTNFFGVVQSRTNTVQYMAENTFGPYTNSYSAVNTFEVPANTTLTWTPTTAVIMDIGTVVQVSATNLTATVNYNVR